MSSQPFVDPVLPGRAVVKALWVWVAIEIAAGAASLLALLQLAGHQPGETMTDTITPAGAEIGVTATTFTTIAQFLAFAVAGIMILRWIHRVVSNAHVMADGLTVSPGWAVGWYFVPVANLWKPFAAIREAWAVATAPERWGEVSAPALLRWWWGLWITTNSIDNASFRLSIHANTVGENLSVTGLDLLSAILSVPLGILLIRIVTQLSAMQLQSHQARTFE